MKSFLAKIFANSVSKKIKRESFHALDFQEKIFHYLLKKAEKTKFGNDHHFDSIKNYEDFKNAVPIRDYEGLKSYIDLAIDGNENIFWPGKPLYWSKTSGTTSGVKYIPISKTSIKNHIHAARNVLLCYIAETGNANFVNGKMIFLSGSPKLESKNGIPVGRLSGIVNHHIPQYLRNNQMPSFETNCVDDWEKKVDKIVEETRDEKMTLISGIPPWVQMYFDKLVEIKNKKIKDIFPNFKLFVHGGVNFEPYRAKLEDCIGEKIDTIETYPASEGFIAFQDSQTEKGLLLLTNNGIFYEFILADEFFNASAKRISLKDIELNKNYAIILNTNAGLFAYSIGDTVKFVSINPYRIVVTGRIKHFISAFGEHVIVEEVEEAILQIAKQEGVEIVEFTVAPKINPSNGGLPFHEWFVEFGKEPIDLKKFSEKVDIALQHKNIYYKDLILGNILKQLVIHSMPKKSFIEFMKSQGKLGGQNKVPRLSNDRKIADELVKFIKRD